MILDNIVAVCKDHGVHSLLQPLCNTVRVADDPNELYDIVRTENPDLIVFDSTFGPERIRDFIVTSNTHLANTFIIVIGPNESDDATKLYGDLGVQAYINYNEFQKKPEHFIKSVAAEYHKNTDSTPDWFLSPIAEQVGLAGKSPAMADTLKMIDLVAASNCDPVLIIGKTGTGKELAAKAIHAIRHPNQPFVAINCAALNATLLESELFGHVKGAFTGAEKTKTGLLELADGGTIFLDEISEMAIDLQAKLLRLLQEKTFRRVGGTEDVECKVTIVAASNRDLMKEVREKKFRQDLYYRLNICPITLASLSHPRRRGDIELLADYFLQTSAIFPEKSAKIEAFTKMAINALTNHNWPGNVRELKNTIDRAILLETAVKIGSSSIVLCPDIDEELNDSDEMPRLNTLKNLSLANAEKELIAKALEQTRWQKTLAAEALGITRATLYSKVKQYNIIPREQEVLLPA